MKIYTTDGSCHILDEEKISKISYFTTKVELTDKTTEKEENEKNVLKKQIDEIDLEIIKLYSQKRFFGYKKQIKQLNDKKTVCTGRMGLKSHLMYPLSSYSNIYMPIITIKIDKNQYAFHYKQLELDSLNYLLYNYFKLTIQNALSIITEKNKEFTYNDGTRIWSDETIEKFVKYTK